jgi:hypothetical protein
MEYEMNATRWDATFEPGLLSRMGGGGNSGSNTTQEERERQDRKNQGDDMDTASGDDPRRRTPAAPDSPATENPSPNRKNDSPS